MPRTIFFGQQSQFARWEEDHPDARDVQRANLPPTFRRMRIDTSTEAVDMLPNTWRHWGVLIEWIEDQTGEAAARDDDDIEVTELSESMAALLRRARVLNGVAIPARNVGGENVQLDLGGDDSAPPSIHAIYFGSRQRYLEYARSQGRRYSVPRSAVLHVTEPRQLLSINNIASATQVESYISSATQVESSLADDDAGWYDYLSAMTQLLVRAGLTREGAHPTFRTFLDRAIRNSSVRVVFLGTSERFDRWRVENQYNREIMAPGAVLHVANPRAMRGVMPNVRISRFTQVIDQLDSDYTDWPDMLTLLERLLRDVETPHISVSRAIERCRQMIQRFNTEAQMRITRDTPIVVSGGTGSAGGGTITATAGGGGQVGPTSTCSVRTQRRIDELQRQVAILQRALDQIAEDAQRPDAHRLAAAHARRQADGQHILWHATNAPEDYRLISIGEHGDADTLVCYWNTVTQRWEARSDEVWIRR
jgi:hypothetical protein